LRSEIAIGEPKPTNAAYIGRRIKIDLKQASFDPKNREYFGETWFRAMPPTLCTLMERPMLPEA